MERQHIIDNLLVRGIEEMQKDFCRSFVSEFQCRLEEIIKKYDIPEKLKQELIGLGLGYEGQYRYR